MQRTPRKVLISKEEIAKLQLVFSSAIEYLPSEKKILVSVTVGISYPNSTYLLGNVPITGNAIASRILSYSFDKSQDFDSVESKIRKKANDELDQIKSELQSILEKGNPHLFVDLEQMIDRIVAKISSE